MEILKATNITKEFGTLVAVNDVSFSLGPGQVLGLIGPNGAGKTTLLKILATVMRPTSGFVQLLKYNSKKQYLKIRKHVGYLPDFFNLYNDLTLRECLEVFARAYKVETKSIPGRINEVLEQIELSDKRNNLIRHLSRGMVQRMGVGVLLVYNPDLFLLDEPASGLDPKARIQLRKILSKLADEGKTIIISSHILSELSGFCTHISLMNEGKIVVHGAIEEIQKQVHESKKIHLSVLGECEQATQLIKEYPNTQITAVKNNSITVEIKGNEAELAGLNSHLTTKGVKIYQFYEEKTDIEDLFMKISSSEKK